MKAALLEIVRRKQRSNVALAITMTVRLTRN